MALSDRMRSTVESVMPKIATQVAQRSSSNPPIDFGTAENWLIRPELVEFFKNRISQELVEQVGNNIHLHWYEESMMVDDWDRTFHIRRAFLVIRGSYRRWQILLTDYFHPRFQ